MLSSFSFKKKELIYIKHNSITADLCEDIINHFDESYNNEETRVLFDEVYDEGEKETQPIIKYKIPIIKNMIKTKNFLYEELNKNIHKYLSQYNNIPEYVPIKDITENVLVIRQITIDFEFTIYKYNNFMWNINNLNNKKIIKENNKVAKFYYIWFLNDCAIKYEFWRTTNYAYTIEPKVGTLFIFPISWCFPYRVKWDNTTEKYVIGGYIYM